MKPFLCFLAVVLWVGAAFAQRPPLYKVIDPNPANMYQTDLGKNIICMDSFYYINYAYISPEWLGEEGILKTDPKGNIIKHVVIRDPASSLVFYPGTTDCVTRDSFLLFTGTSFDTLLKRQHIFFIKLTRDLEIVWIKRYGPSNRDYYCNSVVETEDGRYIIHACEPSQNRRSAWLRLLCTDTSGTLLWDRVVPDTFNWAANGNVIRTADGNLLSTAHTYNSLLLTYGCLMTKTDPQGNVLWQRALPFAESDLGSAMSTPMPDGGSVLMWGKDTSVWIPGLLRGNMPVLRRYSPSGAWLWEVEWPLGFHRILRVITAANGDIIGGGFRVPNYQTYDYGWMFRVSPEGEVKWNRYFSDSLVRPWNAFGIQDLAETPEGDIIATGIVTDTVVEGGIANMNVLLLRVGADGCLQKDCGDRTQYITPVQEVFRVPFGASLARLEVSPNPVGAQLRVVLPEAGGPARQLEWYGLSGRQLGTVAVEAHQREATLLTEDLPTGAYWLLLREAGLPVARALVFVRR